MARLPKIRVSYFNDAQFLLRLINAIERDTERPLAWRKARIAELQALADAFLHAPQPKQVKAA